MRKPIGIAAIIALGMALSVPGQPLSPVHAQSGTLAAPGGTLAGTVTCGLLVNGGLTDVPFSCGTLTMQTLTDLDNDAASDAECAEFSPQGDPFTGLIPDKYTDTSGYPFQAPNQSQFFQGDFSVNTSYFSVVRGSPVPDDYEFQHFQFNGVPAGVCAEISVSFGGFYGGRQWNSTPLTPYTRPYLIASHPCYVGVYTSTLSTPLSINCVFEANTYQTTPAATVATLMHTGAGLVSVPAPIYPQVKGAGL